MIVRLLERLAFWRSPAHASYSPAPPSTITMGGAVPPTSDRPLWTLDVFQAKKGDEGVDDLLTPGLARAGPGADGAPHPAPPSPEGAEGPPGESLAAGCLGGAARH